MKHVIKGIVWIFDSFIPIAELHHEDKLLRQISALLLIPLTVDGTRERKITVLQLTHAMRFRLAVISSTSKLNLTTYSHT